MNPDRQVLWLTVVTCVLTCVLTCVMTCVLIWARPVGAGPEAPQRASKQLQWLVGKFRVKLPRYCLLHRARGRQPAHACNLTRTRCIFAWAAPHGRHPTPRRELARLRAGTHPLAQLVGLVVWKGRGKLQCGRAGPKSCRYDQLWSRGMIHPRILKNRRPFSVFGLSVRHRSSWDGLTVLVASRGPAMNVRGIITELRYNARALELY